jgi:hypothetical protein
VWRTVYDDPVAAGTVAAAITAIVGVAYAARQLSDAKKARKVDRVLELHREFSTGEIAAARSRFSELMWRAGELAFGLTNESISNIDFRMGYCWQPTWRSLYPSTSECEGASTFERFLGVYPDGIPGAEESRPLYDLRKVLWSFERINDALSENLQEDLILSLFGWHVVWWEIVTRRLDRELGAILQPLDELTKWVAKRNRRVWMKRRLYDPHNDFQGSAKYDDPTFLKKLGDIEGIYSTHEEKLQRLAARGCLAEPPRRPCAAVRALREGPAVTSFFTASRARLRRAKRSGPGPRLAKNARTSYGERERPGSAVP